MAKHTALERCSFKRRKRDCSKTGKSLIGATVTRRRHMAQLNLGKKFPGKREN